MSANDDGKTFSEVYFERGEPTADAPLLRGRLGMFLDKQLPLQLQVAIANEFSTRWGRSISYAGLGTIFKEMPLAGVLNAITFAFRALETKYPGPAMSWLRFANSVFSEENLTYRVNEKGGVRYSPDQEFDSSRAATIAVLTNRKYATVLQSYQLALEDLRTGTLAGEAIRHTFDAVENLVKLMIGDKISRLGPPEIEKYLRPLILDKLGDPERSAASQFLESFKAWSNAAQQYRHAPGTEAPQPPSIEFAVAMVSTGAGYLRWLTKFCGSA